MTELRFIILILGIIALGLMSCGNQVSLTGGPKDEVPPRLITEESSANYVTNFEKSDITLNFDEYINLKDAANQILISPPLQYPPKIASRLKKLTVGFDDKEELKEDVTYIVNFGKSITDYTESNELLNFTYVFSTGDYIDSLSVAGTVIDAETNEPVKEALVLLYIDHQDSIVYKENPFYFATTGEDGSYRINNLRSDSFKVVALVDNNLDYLFDSQSESIGFIDSLIVLEDSVTTGVDLEIFKEAGPSSYRSYEVEAQGKAKIEFTGPVEGDELRILDSVVHIVTYDEGSPLSYLWYLPSDRRSVRYEVLRNDILDTVSLRVNTRTTDTLDRVKVRKLSAGPKLGLHPDLPLVITFDRPISSIDTSLVSLIDTSMSLSVKPNMSISTDSPLDVVIAPPWESGAELVMTLYPGAITDFFGKSHDTLTREVMIADTVEFGSIKVRLINTDSVNYVVTLLKADERLKTFIWESSIEQEDLLFEKLEPSVYQLEIVFDEIPNGIWDPGNYLEHRQSEDKYTITLPELRANWVHEEIINIRNLTSQEVIVEVSEAAQDK